MMAVQVFGSEMRVKHHREQDIREPAFAFVLLVHEFMGIVDADGAGNDPDAEKRPMVAAIERWSVWVAYQIRPNSVVNCRKGQIIVTARYQ